MIRILLVEDHELLRRGLRLLLGTVPDVAVAAEAANGAEALTTLNALAKDASSPGIDLVLTDVRMPTMDGLELTRQVRARYQIPVLALTTFEEASLVRGLLAAGAGGYLLKDVSTEGLAEAIRAVIDGGLVLDPRVARFATEPDPVAHELAVLTPAERQVAELVATGATNAEIAATLYLAEGTVKNQVSALLRKLGARDRTALALTLVRALGGGTPTEVTGRA